MKTCSKHSGNPYVMVCLSCDKQCQFVCCECIAREHRGHDLETFETTANTVLERLRKDKSLASAKLKDLHVELKNCASVQENERKKSETTRQFIQRRRELLKMTIDEAAEILLEKQELSDKRITHELRISKQHAENQVKNILEFQSNLAILENLTDYQHMINSGKDMCFNNFSQRHSPIPAITRHTLRRRNTINRKLVREMFGEEVEEDIGASYIRILHCLEGEKEGDTDSVSTTDLFPEATEYEDDVSDRHNADSDGNIGSSKTQRHLGAVGTCNSRSPPITSEMEKERQESNGIKCGIMYTNSSRETAALSLTSHHKPESQNMAACENQLEKTILMWENRGYASITRASNSRDDNGCQGHSQLQYKTLKEDFVKRTVNNLSSRVLKHGTFTNREGCV